MSTSTISLPTLTADVVESLMADVAALTARVAALELSGAKPSGKAPKAPKAPKVVSEASDESQKPKRESSDGFKKWSAFASNTLRVMREEGWPAFVDLEGRSWAASGKKVTVKHEGAEKEWFTFSDSEKVPSPSDGGMKYAQLLWHQMYPETKDKAVKRRDKKVASKTASVASQEVREEPVADAEGAKPSEPVAAAAVAPAAAPAPEKPKRVMSDEQKAKMKAGREAAKAKRDAEKAAAKGAPAAAPAAPAPKPAPKPAAKAEEDFEDVESDDGSTPKPPMPKDAKALLTFYSWTHEGEEYFKNARGDVISNPDMAWVGRWTGSKIDEEAEQPDDLDDAPIANE